MKWVTRERPKTDRIACPWLIKNFIDPDAEFLYVPADQVLAVAEREGAHSYDAPGATYTHRDGLCSFEVLLEEYELDDPALALLARIVHGADVAEDRDATPQSRGLLAIAEGFHLLDLGDHRQLELSLPVYDALYAWCKARGRARTRREPRARGLHPPAGRREAGLRPRRRLPRRPPDVRRAHRRRPCRRDRLRAAGVPAVAPRPAGSRRRPDRRASTTCCSRATAAPRASASSAAPTSDCSDASPSAPHPNGLAYDRRRRRLYAFNLGEPLGEGCTASVVDRRLDAAQSPSSALPGPARAGRSTTPSATASTRTSASRRGSSSSTPSA